MKQTTVEEIMIRKENIVTISAYAKVREILQLMKSKNVKSVIVDRSNDTDAYGIVTYTSILNAIFAEDGDMDLLNVYDIATKPIIQVSEKIDIRYAARMMVRYGVNRLLVSSGNELRGLITMNDIVSVLIKEAEREI
jgi:signal-transduction protein with cAMP-binding, CBS, and nucleotidyltransferase domain